MDNRTIIAIGKHIIAEDALPGSSKFVGIEESAGFGVVVAGLEVIQASLFNAHLATRPFCAPNQALETRA